MHDPATIGSTEGAGMTDDEDQRFDAFAAAIMAAYDAYRGEPYGARDWAATDGTVSDETRERYRRAADAVLDAVEWTRFGLGPKS
jgi:hypothetical protein